MAPPMVRAPPARTVAAVGTPRGLAVVALLAATCRASDSPALRASASGTLRLDWEAKGHSFFDGFNFQTYDGNHGAASFVSSLGEAKAAGVVETTESSAILRAGRVSPQLKYKRETAKIGTKKAWKHFLAVMKYDHVPYGCGVWPAFYTLGVGEQWPMGGEMDILEYVNDQGSMTSFHVGRECVLDPAEVNKYGPTPDANQAENGGSQYNCLTKYCDTCKSLGCAPNKLPLLTGKSWASRPGALAMQRTAKFAKIFFIPEGEIPGELENGEANPDKWDRWVIAYYPFGYSAGCPDPDNIMAPQQFVLSIAFCGDWASKVWGKSPICSQTGPLHNSTATEQKLKILAGQRQCRAVDPLAEFAPEEDCCTQFIADASGEFGADEYLKESAYFKISWFRVFT